MMIIIIKTTLILIEIVMITIIARDLHLIQMSCVKLGIW